MLRRESRPAYSQCFRWGEELGLEGVEFRSSVLSGGRAFAGPLVAGRVSFRILIRKMFSGQLTGEVVELLHLSVWNPRGMKSSSFFTQSNKRVCGQLCARKKEARVSLYIVSLRLLDLAGRGHGSWGVHAACLHALKTAGTKQPDTRAKIKLRICQCVYDYANSVHVAICSMG